MFKQSINQIKHGLTIFYKTVPFALRAVWQASPLLLILVIFTTIINGSFPMAVIWIGKQVLDSIVNAVKAGWNPAEAMVVYQWLGLQLLVILIEMSFRRGNTFLILIMGKRLSLYMRKNVLEKASSLDLATFEDSEFYDKISRARNESRGTPLRLIQRFQATICGTITFFSMGTLIASLSLALFVVMILVCMPLLIVLVKYSEKQYQLLYTRSEKLRKIKYISNIMTTRHYIPEIINLGLRPYLMHKWFDYSQRFYHEDVQLIKRQNLAALSVNSVVAASKVGATGYVIFLGMKVLSLSVGQIVMYSEAFAQGLNSLRQGVEDITGMYEELLFLSNLIEFHKIEPHTKVKKKAIPLPGEIESIEVQNVTFKYPGAQDNVLKNITVTFKRSERTLLVGANGAGKTTLIKLIMRLYDPEEGRILINGIDIREFNMQALQQAIGVIFQDYVRFAVTVKENIGYGFINELENQKRIEEAAKMARADKLIKRLPHKYDTILSKLFRNGQELSLGQWQRICLARLFMKKSPILILDEPTARLDIETEEHLFHEINRISRNRICILASHRMFQQGIADQIVVLKKGVLQEVGSYENLMVLNGEFARLRKLYHNITKEYITNDDAVSDTTSSKLIQIRSKYTHSVHRNIN